MRLPLHFVITKMHIPAINSNMSDGDDDKSDQGLHT